MKKPLVSIIIVNWNAKEMLRNCLNSIRENTTYPNYKIVVVDNGSTDGSVEMIKKEFPHVQLIQNKENIGFAKANNQGIKSIESDYYFLIGNDTEVTKNWLTSMIEVSESDSKFGITGCKLIFPNGRIQHAGAWVKIHGVEHCLREKGDKLRQVDYVTGAAFLIKKEVIDKIGLLDEGFSPFYYEDSDYCVRARKAGYKIIYNPKTAIIHHTAYSMKKQSLPFVYFIKEKNRIRFILLNFPLPWLILRVPYEIRRFGATLAGLYGETSQMLPLFVKAWLVNLKGLKEILRKRRCRTMKI